MKYEKFPIYNAGIEAVKDYNDSSRVKTTAPKVQLIINPFIPPWIPIELVSSDLGGLIQSCEVAKSRSMPGGMFTVTIVADDKEITKNMPPGAFKGLWEIMGSSAEDLFRPMAMAQLWINGYHVMTGYIEQCRKRTDANGNKFYHIQFSELGNLYSKNIGKSDMIVWGLSMYAFADLKKLLYFGNKMVAAPLAAAIWSYVNAFIYSSLSYGPACLPTPWWSFSDGLPAALRLIAQPPPLGGISFNSLLSTITTDSTLFKQGGGSSFWDFLKSLAPEPFIEMFTESGGRTVCVGRSISSATSLTSTGLFSVGGSAIAASIPMPSIGVTFTLPGFNYLIVRTSPYSNPLHGIGLWNAALFPFMLGVIDLILAGDYIIITDDDVIEKDLGRSELQQYTLFNAPLVGKAAQDAGKMFGRPAVSEGPLMPFMPGGAKSFGAREMEATFPMHSLQWAGIVGQSVEKIAAQTVGSPIPGLMSLPISALSSILKFWFRNASKFREGTIVTRAIPYARPGMVLLYMPSRRQGAKVDNPRDIGIYYVDNMQYNYNLGKAPTTTFSLIRGTPAPFGSKSISNLALLLMDWEVHPVGLNLFDGSP